VARFTIKEPQEGHRDTHTSENTLCVYVQSIDGGACRCSSYADRCKTEL
jgi:hypothetical protein